MLKAADTFAGAGHDVRVISARFMEWATAADEVVTSRRRQWRSIVVDYSRSSAATTAVQTGVRHRVTRWATRMLGSASAPSWLATRAFSRAHAELTREAARAPADLIYGGTSGALAAVVAASVHLNVPYALDLEDLHTAESVEPGAAFQHALASRIELDAIPDAAFVTTSSGPIAEAYERRYRRRPTVIHNVFPLPAQPPIIEASDAPLRLYWFGQTIGPGRALEDVVDALAMAGVPATIDLRGRAIDGYVSSLRARAAASAPNIAIEVLPPVHPDAVVDSCRGYDIGISTEDPIVENRERCLSNKFCVYLLTGLAVAATDTPGQRTLASDIGCGAAWYETGNVRPLAHVLQTWHMDRAALLEARHASWNAARQRWHWEHQDESGALLGLVGMALA